MDDLRVTLDGDRKHLPKQDESNKRISVGWESTVQTIETHTDHYKLSLIENFTSLFANKSTIKTKRVPISVYFSRSKHWLEGRLVDLNCCCCSTREGVRVPSLISGIMKVNVFLMVKYSSLFPFTCPFFPKLLFFQVGNFFSHKSFLQSRKQIFFAKKQTNNFSVNIWRFWQEMFFII